MNQVNFYPGAINASDCVSNGWNLIKQNYGLFLGITFVATIILMVIGCIPFLSIIINPILTGPIFVGVYYAYLKQMRGEPTDFGMLFRGFNSFVPAMIVSLTAAAPVIILQIINLFSNFSRIAMTIIMNRGSQSSGKTEALFAGGIAIVLFILMLVFFVISIVVQIALFFALPLLADNEGMSAGDAMKLSVKAAGSNIGGLILLGLLNFLIALVGVIALCIGIFFVIPLIYAANAFAYRQVFPDTKQNFQNSPPPPNTYGNNYGFGQ